VPEGTDEVLDPTWESEDIVAVRKVFTLFDEIIEKTNGRLQIIVLDHASEEVWGGLKNVHLVDEWRGRGLFLRHGGMHNALAFLGAIVP
jgi:hypothetical protein